MVFSCDLCDCEGISSNFNTFVEYQNHCIDKHDYTPDNEIINGDNKINNKQPSKIKCEWIDNQGKRCQQNQKYIDSIFCHYHYRSTHYDVSNARIEIEQKTIGEKCSL